MAEYKTRNLPVVRILPVTDQSAYNEEPEALVPATDEEANDKDESKTAPKGAKGTVKETPEL